MRTRSAACWTAGLLSVALGCTPTVASVGDTLLSDGQDDAGTEAASAGDDDPSAEGHSPGEGDTGASGCADDLGPAWAALLDALDRADAAVGSIGADVDAVRMAEAARLGLPADASADAVAAAITAEIEANTSGGHELRVDTIRCSGSIPAARESVAICVPEVEPQTVIFDCADACLVENAASCSVPPSCLGPSTICEGTCTGECGVEAGGSCDGRCLGSCDGECDCLTKAGECAGRCSGTCHGTCEAVATSCGDTCLGICERMSFACDAGQAFCPTSGGTCTLDCDSAATPVGLAVPCPVIAALASAAAMDCPAPAAELRYELAAGIDHDACTAFSVAADDLATAGARLARDLHRLEAIGAAVAPVGEAVADVLSWLPPASNACVVPAINDAVERLTDLSSQYNGIAADATTLHDAIAL